MEDTSKVVSLKCHFTNDTETILFIEQLIKDCFTFQFFYAYWLFKKIAQFYHLLPVLLKSLDSYFIFEFCRQGMHLL